MTTPTKRLSDLGVSIWLDDLSRDRIASGGLAELIQTRDVVGVTTNPTIFALAVAAGAQYDEQLASLAEAGASPEDAVFQITTDDVRAACDVFLPVYEASDGRDGRVSIEVSPDLAFDTEATVTQALDLWSAVDRPNAMIKIPATAEGLPAITEVLGRGVSVNVTLIFSLARYAEVIDAYLAGLELAKAAGHDLQAIRSVASFFVSRLDTEVDRRLGDDHPALRSQAGIANARLAYAHFRDAFAGDRATALLAVGAHRQRPLWASTGVKDPKLPDTLYVTELAAPDTVNTMPAATLEATFDHAPVGGDAVSGAFDDARDVLRALAEAGIDIDEVTALLEREGVEKFLVSWHELLATVREALEATKGD